MLCMHAWPENKKIHALSVGKIEIFGFYVFCSDEQSFQFLFNTLNLEL